MLPLLTTGDVILVETLFLKVHGQSLALLQGGPFYSLATFVA